MPTVYCANKEADDKVAKQVDLICHQEVTRAFKLSISVMGATRGRRMLPMSFGVAAFKGLISLHFDDWVSTLTPSHIINATRVLRLPYDLVRK